MFPSQVNLLLSTDPSSWTPGRNWSRHLQIFNKEKMDLKRQDPGDLLLVTSNTSKIIETCETNVFINPYNMWPRIWSAPIRTKKLFPSDMEMMACYCGNNFEFNCYCSPNNKYIILGIANVLSEPTKIFRVDKMIFLLSHKVWMIQPGVTVDWEIQLHKLLLSQTSTLIPGNTLRTLCCFTSLDQHFSFIETSPKFYIWSTGLDLLLESSEVQKVSKCKCLQVLMVLMAVT